ncbi:MAG: hypothetical protein GXO00_03570 [Candidatus Diapherotrites archaeon]|nr:hypothetical protein [Candidatus Diapherotrites archaeon]
MGINPKMLTVFSKLSELGATPVEIAYLLEQLPPEATEEDIYELLKKINPELAEEFRREMSLVVWRTDLRREPFRRDRIVKSLTKETGISKSLAEKIAREVEEKIRETELGLITSSLVRELALIRLIEYGMEDAYKRYLRLGVPVHDLLVMVKKGSKDLVKRVAGRIFLQYSVMFLLPKPVAEALFDGFVDIGGLYNPFVPFAQTYYTRVSEPERWFEGLTRYLMESPFVDRPSIYVPPFLEEAHLSVLKSLSRAAGAILWSTENLEGVIRSDVPVYSFGRVPERRVLDLVTVNVEKIVLHSSNYLHRLEEIAGGLEEYQEKKKDFVKAGNLYVRLEGLERVEERDRVLDVFSDFRILGE